jgi:hypothetical protein
MSEALESGLPTDPQHGADLLPGVAISPGTLHRPANPGLCSVSQSSRHPYGVQRRRPIQQGCLFRHHDVNIVLTNIVCQRSSDIRTAPTSLAIASSRAPTGRIAVSFAPPNTLLNRQFTTTPFAVRLLANLCHALPFPSTRTHRLAHEISIEKK